MHCLPQALIPLQPVEPVRAGDGAEDIAAVVIKAEERKKPAGGVDLFIEGLIAAEDKQGIGNKGEQRLLLLAGVQMSRPRHQRRQHPGYDRRFVPRMRQFIQGGDEFLRGRPVTLAFIQGKQFIPGRRVIFKLQAGPCHIPSRLFRKGMRRVFTDKTGIAVQRLIEIFIKPETLAYLEGRLDALLPACIKHHQLTVKLNSLVVLRAHFVAAGNLETHAGNRRMVRVKVDEAIVFGHRLVVVALLKQVVGETKQRCFRIPRGRWVDRSFIFHGCLERQSALRQAVGKCFDCAGIGQRRHRTGFSREGKRKEAAGCCGKCRECNRDQEGSSHRVRALL